MYRRDSAGSHRSACPARHGEVLQRAGLAARSPSKVRPRVQLSARGGALDVSRPSPDRLGGVGADHRCGCPIRSPGSLEALRPAQALSPTKFTKWYPAAAARHDRVVVVGIAQVAVGAGLGLSGAPCAGKRPTACEEAADETGGCSDVDSLAVSWSTTIPGRGRAESADVLLGVVAAERNISSRATAIVGRKLRSAARVRGIGVRKMASIGRWQRPARRQETGGQVKQASRWGEGELAVGHPSRKVKGRPRRARQKLWRGPDRMLQQGQGSAGRTRLEGGRLDRCCRGRLPPIRGWDRRSSAGQHAAASRRPFERRRAVLVASSRDCAGGGAATFEVRRLAYSRAEPWQSRQLISIAFATSP